MATSNQSLFEYLSITEARREFIDYIARQPHMAVSAHRAACKRYGYQEWEAVLEDAFSVHAHMSFVSRLNARYNHPLDPPIDSKLLTYLQYHERLLTVGTLAVARQTGSRPLPARYKETPTRISTPSRLFSSVLLCNASVSYAQGAKFTPLSWIVAVLGKDVKSYLAGNLHMIIAALYLGFEMLILSELSIWLDPPTPAYFLIVPLWLSWSCLGWVGSIPEMRYARMTYTGKTFRAVTNWNSVLGSNAEITMYFLGEMSMLHLESDAGLKAGWLSGHPWYVLSMRGALEDPELYTEFLQFYAGSQMPYLPARES